MAGLRADGIAPVPLAALLAVLSASIIQTLETLPGRWVARRWIVDVDVTAAFTLLTSSTDHIRVAPPAERAPAGSHDRHMTITLYGSNIMTHGQNERLEITEKIRDNEARWLHKTRKTTAKMGGLCEERPEKGRGGRKVERKGQQQGPNYKSSRTSD